MTRDMGAHAPKSYARAEFRVHAVLADEAAALLMARGALGCAVKGNLFRRRPPSVVVLQAFFTRLSRHAHEEAWKALAQSGMLAPGARAGRVHAVVDPGWSTLWQKRFKPLKIGRRFLILPPWSCAEDPTRLRIVIEPAQAFGTGHHPTTAGVLRALEIECAARRIASALDVGTGSGILAIALKLLGVAKVVGIDIAAEAIANARRNAELNGLSGEIRFSSAGLSTFKRPFDLIAANIGLNELIVATPIFKRLLAAGGSLILSGILRREAGTLLERYRSDFHCLRETSERGWTTLVLGA
jgi:ribosomal protein L11 methyltransferase